MQLSEINFKNGYTTYPEINVREIDAETSIFRARLYDQKGNVVFENKGWETTYKEAKEKAKELVIKESAKYKASSDE